MEPIEARINSYVPRQMPAAEWALATSAARSVVLAAAPRSPDHAKALLSRLCAFLASSRVWDRASTPNLGRLLTSDAVEAHCARLIKGGGKASSAAIYRTDLRRLVVAAAGLPIVAAGERAVRRPNRIADVRLVTLTAAGHPLVAVAAAWRELVGRNLGEHLLGAVTGSLRAFTQSEVWACLDSAGEISAPGRAAVTARKARASKADKPMSLAARRRYAAERISEATRLAAGPQVVTEAPEIPAAAAEFIAAYRPQEVESSEWVLVQGAWARLAAGYQPTGARHASHIARHIADFLLWFRTHPVRDDQTVAVVLTELTTPGLVDAWVASRANPESSKITMRSTVNRAIRSLDPDPDRGKLAYRPRKAPYTEAECEQLRTIADAQKTPIGRKNASFVVGLSGGAGLDGRDLRHLRRRYIHTETLPDGRQILIVDVHGPRPRTVVVRGYFAATVQAACDIHDELIADPDALVIGTKLDRTNITTPVTMRTVTAVAGQKVDFDVNRLRSAWMVAMMSAAVPLNVLLDAAGVKTARPIVDLLPYCPTVPRTTALTILDAAGLTPGAQS